MINFIPWERKKKGKPWEIWMEGNTEKMTVDAYEEGIGITRVCWGIGDIFFKQLS